MKLLHKLNDFPQKPFSLDSSPLSQWRADLEDFKSELLEHLSYFDKIMWTISSSLKDYHYIRDNATLTEIANLYLVKIAIS